MTFLWIIIGFTYFLPIVWLLVWLIYFISKSSNFDSVYSEGQLMLAASKSPLRNLPLWLVATLIILCPIANIIFLYRFLVGEGILK